ncbi:hypothetical protein [Clostridium butyricum]|uniref:hypothetical protein n=1 Tax=Clostridium butyricum TaxID=1492 RepID=UPI0022E62F93|nr:hypothetical protein [Clostridium butyricum]
MNNNDVGNILQTFIDEINSNHIQSSYLYAFKTKVAQNSNNNYISLDYNFFEIQISPSTVKNTFKNLLCFFKKSKLDNNDTTFEEYAISNPKNVIDYIRLTNIDFSEPLIANGTDANLNSDNYKVQYFLNLLNNNSVTAQNKRDYNKFKHSVLKLITNDNKTIYIVNRVSPIYKPKGMLFTFNTDDDEIDNNFKPLTKYCFRLPFYPHIIITDEYCFLIEPNVESIFGFEKYNKKIRDESLLLIKNEIRLSDDSYNLINTYSNKGKNYNYFSRFDSNRYEKVKNNDPSTIELLKNKIGLNIDTSGNIILPDEAVAEKFILYLCNCIFMDLEDNVTLYESKNTKVITS